MGLLRS